MAPSMFTRPAIPSQEPRHSTVSHQQKLKSISSFFPLFAHPASNLIDESHVIPYRQPDSSSQHTATVFDGLPKIKNNSNISLPLRSSQHTISPSQSSPCLKVTLQQTTSKGHAVTYTSHNLQQQMSKEMPTLASAIHIPDSSISSSLSPLSSSKASVDGVKQNHSGVHPLYHLNTSSTSLLGSYVQVNEIIHVVNVDMPSDHSTSSGGEVGVGKRERSNSRSSTFSQTTKRLTRRLSLDNIVPKITSRGSLRRRERSGSKSSILDGGGGLAEGRRWSLFSSSNANVNTNAIQPPQEAQTKHVMGERSISRAVNKQSMPVSRNWRNKFTVKNTSTTRTSGGKENTGVGITMGMDDRLEAARQARDRSRAESAEYRERYDERTIKRIPVRGMRDMSFSGFGSGNEDRLKERESMISMLIGSGGMRERDEISATRLSFVHKPSSRASSFDPAATPKSTSSSSIPIPFVPIGPPPQQSSLVESQTTTSLAATFDSPSPLPRPVHTPLNRVAGLRIPSATANRSAILSPAQDDRSILDPARSPCPIPDMSPLLPLNTGLQYQNMPLPPPPVQVNQNMAISDAKKMEVAENEPMDLSSLDKSLDEIMKPSISNITTTIAAQPSQTGTFGVSDSNQTWHTATTSPPPLLPTSSSTRTMCTLPRSKSKSHTDLSSYSSTKNLVDHIEATQGPGWWSTDKRVNRRVSTMTLRYKAEDEDRELERLERLAQSTTIPHRPKFDDITQEEEIVVSPTMNRTREEDKLRTRSSLDLRSSSQSTSTANASTIRSSNVLGNDTIRSGHHPRPSLMAGSIWFKELPPSPRRSVLSRQIEPANGDTPVKIRPAQIHLPLSEPRNNTFISNRISPDIARRASFLSKDSTTMADVESPSRSTSRQTTRTTLSADSTSTAPTSVQSDGEEQEKISGKVEMLKKEYEEKIANLRSRHALEIDAVLTALSNAKIENASLKEEVISLRKVVDEGTQEKEGLKEKVKILCMSLQTIELGGITSPQGGQRDESGMGKGMKRSESVVSSLLPELISTTNLSDPIAPLPLSSTTHRQIDEFGRKQMTIHEPLTSDSIGREEMRNKGIMDSLSKTRVGKSNVIGGSSRKVSGATSVHTDGSNILYDEDEEIERHGEGEGEGWTLRLKESDERFLDDL
ncbi:hypothetical protein V865_002513 [Kwoniella europaea PYCC6329]|uniref:Uncharacterized protein n=1 Tax=Kwoniella europaea PYCC6329 TaxID=1423913 RepID=A0AAX4KEJ3_9TREE